MRTRLLSCLFLLVGGAGHGCYAAAQDASVSAPRVPGILFVEAPGGKRIIYGKVYGDIDTPPIALAQKMAFYPEDLRKKGVQGAAVVKFTLTAKGKMKDFSVQASQSEFGRSALAAAERCEYRAALKAKRPVECVMELLYAFPGPFVSGG